MAKGVPADQEGADREEDADKRVPGDQESADDKGAMWSRR